MPIDGAYFPFSLWSGEKKTKGYSANLSQTHGLRVWLPCSHNALHWQRMTSSFQWSSSASLPKLAEISSAINITGSLDHWEQPPPPPKGETPPPPPPAFPSKSYLSKATQFSAFRCLEVRERGLSPRAVCLPVWHHRLRHLLIRRHRETIWQA